MFHPSLYEQVSIPAAIRLFPTAQQYVQPCQHAQDPHARSGCPWAHQTNRQALHNAERGLLMQSDAGERQLPPTHGRAAQGEEQAVGTVLENSDESAAAAQQNLMTGLHCPWPLFGDDLELARSWLRPQLRGAVSVRTGHMAISLGMGNALIDGLQGGEFQAEAKALREWRFRLARLDGEANPYRHLLPEGLLEHTRATITHCRTTGKALNVRLNGGIGDHLEVLSQLLHWAKEKQCFLNMMMSIERQQQIESLLPYWQEIGAISLESRAQPQFR